MPQVFCSISLYYFSENSVKAFGSQSDKFIGLKYITPFSFLFLFLKEGITLNSTSFLKPKSDSSISLIRGFR